MGTVWSVSLVADGHAEGEARRAIEACFAQVISEMSAWDAGSFIARFNRAPAGSWLAAPDDFVQVLTAGLRLAEQTDAAFDPTIGAIVDRWGFGPSGRALDWVPPSPSELGRLRACAGWSRLAVAPEGRRIQQPGGMKLDLSGIAKGFAVDKVATTLTSLGLTSFLVEIGGELRGRGVKPDGTPWWVQLEPPPGKDPSSPRTLVALYDCAVATSGDYRRFAAYGGHRLAHTIDARTGCPVPATAPSAVTVLHEECMMADALATALTVMGFEAGLSYAAQNDIAALMVGTTDRGWVELMSPRFAAMAG